MKDQVIAYLQAIVDQKEWSWALIAFLYFIVLLFIRTITIKSIIRKSKALERKNYHEIKTNYLNKCGPGWFFIILSTSIIAFVWFRGVSSNLTLEQIALLIAAPFLFCLALISHLSAFNHASLAALKKTEEAQKVF